jgi:hypothetical protein
MEYANDAAAQAAYVTNGSLISNASIDDEDMADITDWTDGDAGTGDSSQATFDSKSCMKMLGGGAGSNSASRVQDLGTFGTRVVFSLKLYHDSLGTVGNSDFFQVRCDDGTHVLLMAFASDGLFIYNDAVPAYVEVGTNIVVQDTWQEWTFDVNFTALTVDIYLNKILQQAGVSWHYGTLLANGNLRFIQYCVNTANTLTYIDWVKVGSATSGGLDAFSESTIKTQGSYSLKGIAVATDSLNKTLTKTF